MSAFADVLTIVCLGVGAFFVLVGGIGVLRFPDLFSRLHASGVSDMLGAGFVMIGLMFQTGASLSTVKLVLLLAFFVLTSPTAAHVVAKCALRNGPGPLVDAEHVDHTQRQGNAAREEESSTS
jgi:multicomponent Na+:H+ antiporter subunit G